MTRANNLRRKQWARTIRSEGTRCHYCGSWVQGETLTWDHIVPRSLGGSWAQTNIVAACASCNQRKGNGIYHSHLKDCDTCRSAFTSTSRRRWIT